MDAAERDDRIDALYAGSLDAFVAARDQLARELRAAGDRESAEAVKQLRKPSRPAFALNQTVRRDRAGFEAVIAAGAALLERQQAALVGRPADGLRDATRRRQDAVRAFAEVAMATLGPGGESARGAIEQTLLAASIDPAAAGAVRAARLATELEPPDIFGALEPGAQVPTARPKPRRARSGPPAAAVSPAKQRPAPKAPEPADADVDVDVDVERAEAEAGVERAEAEVAHRARVLEETRRRAVESTRAAAAAADEARAADDAAAQAAIDHEQARQRLATARARLDGLRRGR
jgi:hypothetical protein